MKIKFLGAAGTVTGSSYVITSDNGQSILVDLGMFQGTPEIEQLNYDEFDYDPSQLLGAILTHAHLDHCGRLPIILPLGFTGSFWMTAPTRDLTELSLLDSAKIAKEDDKPYLFDRELAIRTVAKFVATDYHKRFQIGPFEIFFRDAGHLLGSCIIEITDTKSNSKIRKIVMSGDLGNSPDDLLRNCEIVENADFVVMESTYGDRLHPTDDPLLMLQQEINAIESSPGTLLIPAFSMERSQELLHAIKHLKKEGKVLPETPVYLDGPMAMKATQIYLDYPRLFNRHIEEEIWQDIPFDFPGLTVIKHHRESEHLRNNQDAKVIIAGAGMMNGGRIVSHAAQLLNKDSTRLFSVGYMAEGTLGRELVYERKTEVLIDGKVVDVHATINKTEAMSGHADQKQLIRWLSEIKGIQKVILTHGEDEPRKVLAQKIQSELGIEDIQMPHLNEEIEL